jgi:hypothetical protein
MREFTVKRLTRVAWALHVLPAGGTRMGQRGVRGQHYGPPKKDRQSVQGVRQEIGEEIRGGSAAPVLQRDRNRDIARGDWDRTNRRHDEGASRDDAVNREERPEAQYPQRVRTAGRTLRRRA